MKRLPPFDRRAAWAFLLAYVAVAVFSRPARPPRAPGDIPSAPSVMDEPVVLHEPPPSALETAAEPAILPAAGLAAPEPVVAPPPAAPRPLPPVPELPPAALPEQPPAAIGGAGARAIPRRAEAAPPERAPVTGIALAADKTDHFHDEFVEITLRAETPALLELLRSTGPYVARVERDGRRVTTVGEMSAARLTFDRAQGLYRARWPVPWNAPDGTYQLRLSSQPWPAGAPPAQEGAFRVRSRAFKPLRPGYAVLTLEGFRALDRIPGPDGVKSIEGFPAWAEFIGADALYVQGGESSAFERKLPEEFPWITASYKKVQALGAECHRRGLELGVYALCYMVGGPPEFASDDYKHGWNYDAKGLRFGLDLPKRRGISITEEKRPGDIVKLLSKFRDMPEVDWLGLDYIRPAFGSCELVDDFVAEMPGVTTPPNFSEMTPEQRMTWACRGRYSAPTPERRAEPKFVLSDQWFWYRAHRTAEVVRKIVDGLGEAKPVWAFTLSWNKGWEHGQDPLMMRDAGLDMDAIMLYEADEPMFRGLVSHWGKYTRRDQLNLIVGNQVDWYLHQKTLNPSGPESYIDRILRAARGFHTDRLPVRGVFIHDIHRLLINGVRKGPYKTMEWMMAAGHAITEVRRLNGALPYDVEIEAPDTASPGAEWTARLRLVGGAPGKPVTLKLYSAPDVALSKEDVTLTAEAPEAAVTARWRPDGASAARGNRSFVAFRAAREVPGEKPVIRTRYVQGVRQGIAPAEKGAAAPAASTGTAVSAETGAAPAASTGTAAGGGAPAAETEKKVPLP